MYYFYQPRYQQLPYQHTTYPTAQIPVTVNPRLLYQTANRNVYPPVDPNLLHQSANETKKLMGDANKIIEKFSTSKEFCRKVMDAAQQSKNEEVLSLIRSNGINSQVDVSYNPDGLRLEFKSNINDLECCKLIVSLRWR